jgi:hypothetical protein
MVSGQFTDQAVMIQHLGGSASSRRRAATSPAWIVHGGNSHRVLGVEDQEVAAVCRTAHRSVEPRTEEADNITLSQLPATT